ncbi:hypothetical protein TNCV_3418141 [Trichonephila clavipes]|nr:hypothetical protein TNCV_3418141 [Trichonephila clavipes]
MPRLSEEPWISCAVEIGQVVSSMFYPSQIPFNSVEGMNFRMAQDRGPVVKEITALTSQFLRGLVPRYIHMRWYPLETHMFPQTKPSQFGNNINTSTVCITFDKLIKY